MNAAKMLLMSVLLLMPAVTKKDSQKTIVIAHNSPEILNGRVKQLIELRPDYHTEPQLCPEDTTNFDLNGNPIETRLGMGAKGRTCVITKYINKYKKGRKTETAIASNDKDADKAVYVYNFNGYVVRTERYDKKTGKLYETTKYSYDADGKLITEVNYLDSNRVLFWIQNKYNSRHQLVEKDFYKNGTKFVSKATYKYTLFDSAGNWLKRTEGGYQGETFTVEHKITYY